MTLEERAKRVVEWDAAYGPNDDGTALTEAIADAIRAAVAEERERLCAVLTDVIAACEADIATGHVPSAFCPDTRKRECQMLLSILRGRV